MSVPELLLGIDAGTGGTKAALYDLRGDLRGSATIPSRLRRNGRGHVEQLPDEMEEELAAAVAGALRDAGALGADVAALACDGQMAGIMFVGRDGRARGPYDSWLDTRCDPDVASMRRHADRVIELTGGYPTYSHGPKLLWWMRERPDDVERASAMVMPGSYLAARLGGLDGSSAFIDPTYLHFSCLADTVREAWSPELVAAFGVPDRLLPRIVQPWEVVGEVTSEAAAATGLRPGTPIAAGCGDTAAGLLGAGVVRPGVALDVAGSASVLATCVAEFRPDARNAMLFTARTALEGVYYALAYVQGGGLNLGWFRDAFARDLVARHGDGAFAALDAEAEAVPPGADGVAFVPHLGGRVTPNDPDLRGVIAGFGWQHGRGHVYRALLESIALEYGLYLRATRALHPELREVIVRAVGGGAASALWGRIKADVLGASYRPLLRQEGGALGSALLAGRAVGLVDDVAAHAERFNRTGEGVEADADRHADYRRRVDAYAELLELAGDLARRGAVAAGAP
jgi:xylulokinase